MDKFIDVVRKLVRPFIAVTFTLATIWLTVIDKVSPEVISTATVAIMAFYFGERAALKSPDKKTD